MYSSSPEVSRDDAAVYRLAPDRALVATVDFFTPIVDDAYDFGRIAAANAFSDVYAMGGTPLLALNLVGWPRDKLPYELLGDVLRGGSDPARRLREVAIRAERRELIRIWRENQISDDVLREFEEELDYKESNL